jgi:hypothetical protein
MDGGYVQQHILQMPGQSQARLQVTKRSGSSLKAAEAAIITVGIVRCMKMSGGNGNLNSSLCVLANRPAHGGRTLREGRSEPIRTDCGDQGAR